MRLDRKLAAVLACFLFFVCANVLGQKQSAVDLLLNPIAWETVEAKACNARFRMPRGSKYESREIPAFGQKLENYAYTWSSSNGQLSVSCGVHPFFVDDRETLNNLYDADLSQPFQNAT